MKPLFRAYLILASTAILLTQCAAPTVGSGSGSLPPATKDSPFVNSLGMKFVPVPGTKILMCTTETTVAQYQAAGLGYRAPRFSQGSNHPAVNVSWNDAKAWCAWLSKKEGRRYRLPTEAEWSAAVGTSTYPWGNQWPPPNNAGNYMGQEQKTSAAAFAMWRGAGASAIGVIRGFTDRHVFTSSVGSYPADELGLCDLGGNVTEWCEDGDLPTHKVIRGGSWALCDFRTALRSSQSNNLPSSHRSEAGGFRCVFVR